MSFIIGEVVAPIVGDITPFERAIGQGITMGGRFVSEIGDSMQSVGNGMKNVGENLTKYITLPLAAAATAVFKFGKDYEGELSKVIGLVGVSREQVDLWSKEILKLGPELSKSPKELAEAMFFITSAGIKGAEALDVLEMSGKASAAGLGETKTIADLVTSAMNAYGKENLSAATATDVVTAAVREGKAEASELAGSMGQVLPLAAEMGVTFDQVAAAQAAMTRTGTPATEAATQLKSIMAGLIKPSKQAEEQLDAMGTSSAEMRKKIKDDGLISSLGELKDMTNKYGEEAMARVFPNIRALMGVLDLMGSSAEENAIIFDKVSNSTGALDDAFSAASETMDFKWNQAMSQVQATAIQFFDILKANLLPVLDIVISVLGFVGEKFAALDPVIQQVGLVFATLAAIAGPALILIGGGIAAVGAVISGVGAIMTGLGAIITTIGIPAMMGLLAGFVVVGAAIGAIVAIIAGVVASFLYLWKTNDDFRASAIATWKSIKENAVAIFNDIKSAVSHVWGIIKNIWAKHGEGIMATAKRIWNLIFNQIQTVMKLIRNIVKLITSLIKGDWSGAWSAIKGIIKNGIKAVLNSIKFFGTAIKAAIKAMVNISIKLFKGLISRMKTAINKLVSVGKTLGTKLINGIKNTNFYKTGKNIVQSVIDGIKGMLGSLGDMASKMAQKVRDYLPFSPAKEGPLQDLNKLNFAGPIQDSLKAAQLKVKIPAMNLGGVIMDNLINARALNANGITGSKGIIINGMTVNGVTDLYTFMQEMKEITRRYTGE